MTTIANLLGSVMTAVRLPQAIPENTQPSRDLCARRSFKKVIKHTCYGLYATRQAIN